MKAAVSHQQHLESAKKEHWTMRPPKAIRSLMAKVIRQRRGSKDKHLFESFVRENKHLIGKREAELLTQYGIETQ